MRRASFLKSLPALGIATIIPKEEPFDDSRTIYTWNGRYWAKTYPTVSEVWDTIREYDYVNYRWGGLVEDYRERCARYDNHKGDRRR